MEGVKFEFHKNFYRNKKLIKECDDLAYSQHIDNGGTLRIKGLVVTGHYLLCARDEKGKLVGFVLLYKDYHFAGDLYVAQIAVSKDCVKQGIGSKMLQSIIDNSRGYSMFSADVRADNVASNALFTKMGFEKVPGSNCYALDLRKIENRKSLDLLCLMKRKI